MKIPKTKRKYCKYCKKYTEHSISQAKSSGRSKAHPLSRASTTRLRLRGLRRGAGNYGRYSRPSKPKMTGAKTSKKLDLRFKCKECNKTTVQRAGVRTKKFIFE